MHSVYAVEMRQSPRTSMSSIVRFGTPDSSDKARIDRPESERRFLRLSIRHTVLLLLRCAYEAQDYREDTQDNGKPMHPVESVESDGYSQV